MSLYWYTRIARGVHSLQCPPVILIFRLPIPLSRNVNLQLTSVTCRRYSSVKSSASIHRRLQTKTFWVSHKIELKHNHHKMISVPMRRYFDKSEVTQDALLYINKSAGFYRLVGVFACAQLMFWSYMTYTAFTTMRDTFIFDAVKYGDDGPPEELKNWSSWSGIQRTFSSNKWRYLVTALCVGVGVTIFAGAHLYSRRSVSALVLLKGGNTVTIETFGFFGLRSAFTVPVSNVSCNHSRQQVPSQLPIKVKGRIFHYILDKKGKFLNGRLFDHTAGMKRVFT